jgi:hypothetical protein
MENSTAYNAASEVMEHLLALGVLNLPEQSTDEEFRAVGERLKMVLAVIIHGEYQDIKRAQ